MPAIANKEPETILCNECGNETPFDESLGAEVGKLGQWKDVCRDCYNEIVTTCQLCGEDAMPSDVSEFILCKAELSTTAARPPGIYRVAHRPFLSIPLIGSGSLHGNDVLFVDKLPKPDREYDISGHICHKCAIPYHKIFKRVYRIRKSLAPAMIEMRGCKGREAKWMAVLTGSRKGWDIQKNYTRKTILANPDMLRDLESSPCPKWGEWADIKKHYDLPDGLPTYHDWLFVEHKGVKVYRCYEESTGWLALNPDPEFRNSHKSSPLIFAASGLPTWKSPPEYRYEHPKEDRQAVIDAIDQGILRQDGTFGKDGKPIHCR